MSDTTLDQPTPAPAPQLDQPRRAVPSIGAVRAVRAVMVALLSLVMAGVVMAGPADAAINRGTTWNLTGTGCTLTVGGWPNTKKYPGTASRVTCTARHKVQVRNQLWYAGTDGKAYLAMQGPWHTYTGYGTPELANYWAKCPGRYNWQSSAQVYVDDVYRGNLGNAWGWWTACT